MTKTEIKVICLQAAIESKAPDTLDAAVTFFDWITEDIEFCPHCGEEGLCDSEDNDHGLN